jgi:PH (Pleckstrin Homology) domain-containing protein
VTEPTATIDTTAEELAGAAPEGTAEDAAAETEPTPGGRQLPSWAPMAGAVAAGILVAAPFLRTARQSHVALRPGEEVQMRLRPRRGVIRYLTSVGLWELRRRATRVVVTDQRLLLEDGFVNRVVGSVPLDTIRGVVLRTGPWEAFVNVQTATPRGGKSPEIEIGPLTKRAAVELAAAVSPVGHHEIG